MFRLFRYFKESKLVVALIVALLIVQAYCDLALPQYTSDIVDVGIQQGGIANIAPDVMRPETLATLSLFMPDEEAAEVAAAYAPEGDGNLALQKKDKKTLERLGDLLALPMVMAGSIQEQQGISPEALVKMVEGGLVQKDLLLAGRADALARTQGLGDMMLRQRALLFVRAEYEAAGVDMAALQTRYLWTTGAQMLGITLVMVAAAVLVGFLASRTAAKVGMTLRGSIFKKVVSFSNGDVDTFSIASLITRSTSDIQQVQMIAVMMLRMVFYAPIIGIGGVIKVLATHTGLDWIVVVGVALLLVLFGGLYMLTMPKFKRMQSLLDRVNLIMREILTGLPVIRAFSRQKYETARFDQANTALTKTQLFTQRSMSFLMPMMMLLMNCISLAIVWFAGKGIDLGNLQVGDMIAFMTYTMQIVMSFMMLSMISVFLPRASVSAARIDAVLETQESIADPEHPRDGEVRDWQGVVAFEDVSFRYPDAEKDVLEHITFTARPGQTTAIIGGTGSGKSTLINLIPRFFDVTQGRVTMDGVDIRQITQHALRDLLGYVPQKGVLFSGDIASNIKYGGDDITDADMEEAARIAQADAFIEEKADKYHDAIAQGGTNVSGGQKQRLSIARAIAKKPKVLLFDDSFSALDYKTDVALRRALREKIRGATILIVAQRISTILHADQIIVLEEGRVMGIGTHAELMQTCQAYQDIARSQLSDAELEGGRSA